MSWTEPITLTAFEASIDDSKEQPEDADDDAADIALDNAMIEAALTDVSKTIFPYRALEIQKLWMRRAVRKPKDMTVRKLIAIITKMNKSLTRFRWTPRDNRMGSTSKVESQIRSRQLRTVSLWQGLPNRWSRSNREIWSCASETH
jgi:hypothetical protein